MREPLEGGFQPPEVMLNRQFLQIPWLSIGAQTGDHDEVCQGHSVFQRDVAQAVAIPLCPVRPLPGGFGTMEQEEVEGGHGVMT